MARIAFKGKLKTARYVDGSLAYQYIKVPTLGRNHCDMSAFRLHPKFGCLANSDLFPNVLSRIKSDLLGEWIRLDAVPSGVTVTPGPFLYTITIEV